MSLLKKLTVNSPFSQQHRLPKPKALHLPPLGGEEPHQAELGLAVSKLTTEAQDPGELQDSQHGHARVAALCQGERCPQRPALFLKDQNIKCWQPQYMFQVSSCKGKMGRTDQGTPSTSRSLWA